MTRRSQSEIATDLESRAAKMRAEADRRLSVAADPLCSLLWEAEKAVRAIIAYGGQEAKDAYQGAADNFCYARERRWAKLKEEGRS